MFSPRVRLCLGLGVLFVLYAWYRAYYKGSYYDIDKQLCEFFYEQHAFLFLHKKDFFEYTKTQDLIFSQKEKFFGTPQGRKSKELFLQQANKDMVYIKDLIH